MNIFDLLIVIVLLATFTGVFLAGLIRAIVFLIALWLGLIGADIFGHLIGRLLQRWISDIEFWTANIIGFFLALAIVSSLVVYLLLRSFRTLSTRTGRRFIIRGGIPALFATILLSAVIALASVTILVKATGYAIHQTPVSERPGLLVRQYNDAALRPGVHRIGGYVYDATGSWVPGGTPSVISRHY